MRMHPLPRQIPPAEKEILDRLDCEWTITVPEHLLAVVIHAARKVDTRKSAPLFITRTAHKDHPLIYFHTQRIAPKNSAARRALWAKLEPCKGYLDIQPSLPDGWRIPLSALEGIPFGHGEPITIERIRGASFRFRCAAWENGPVTIHELGMDRLDFSTADNHAMKIAETDWVAANSDYPRKHPTPNETLALLSQIGPIIPTEGWLYAPFDKKTSIALPAVIAENNVFTGQNTLVIAYTLLPT